jgi:transposase
MVYSLGTDISKDEFTACLHAYNPTEQLHQVIARKTFANTPGGFKACMGWVVCHTKEPDAPLRITMEATGVYYESLALYIRAQHSEVHLAVVLPSKSKKYMQSRGLRSKTDKIDAYGLALMGAERSLSPWQGIDPFWRELRALTRTRTNLTDQRTMLRNQLHALEHGGIEVPRAAESLQACIQALSEQINTLTGRIYSYLKTRNQLNEPIEYLKSIPGVGRLTIAVVLAETNGFQAFHSVSQLISFSGYDVMVRQSGQWAGKPRLSKQGSRYIRRAMYMPATTAVRSGQGPIKTFYQRLLAKHSIKMKAHVAVQKKLLRYMYVLWNKKEHFDPQNILDQQAYYGNIDVASPQSEATVDTSSAAA